MSWRYITQQKLQAALLSLAALLTPLHSSYDAHALEPDIAHTPSSVASTPRTVSVIESAIAEAKCATRILEAFAECDSHQLQRYMEDLEGILESIRTHDLTNIASISNLSTNLKRARTDFECNLESARDWCRLAAAVDPSLATFKIPPRFIRIVEDHAQLLEPWSPEARRAWMANLDA